MKFKQVLLRKVPIDLYQAIILEKSKKEGSTIQSIIIDALKERYKHE